MIRINLLPIREERRKASVRQYGALLGAALLGSLAVSGFVHWSITSEIAAARAALIETQRQIDAFGPQLKKVEQYREAKAQIERKLGVIAELEAARSGPVRMLDELAIHTPDRVWITRLGVEGRSVRLAGMSLDNELVAAFMTALNASPYFGRVELRQTQAREVSGFKLNEFELTASLRTPTQDATDTAMVPTDTPATSAGVVAAKRR